MQVMLSVPRPSEAAKFAGQIFSNIDSTTFDIYMPEEGPPTIAEPPFTRGDTLPVFPKVLEDDLLRPRADVVPIFFEGDAPTFLT